MKRICKQCGKEFTLTPSEMNFYRSKNLAFPKRCQDCRTQNKVQRQTETEDDVEETGMKSSEEAAAGSVQAEKKSADVVEKSVQSEKKSADATEKSVQTEKKSADVPESTIQVKQPVEGADISREEPVTNAHPEVYKPQRERPEISKKWWIAVAAVLVIAVAIIFPNFTKKSGSTGTFETKGYTEAAAGGTVSSSENTADSKETGSTASGDKQNTTVKVRFRNNKLLQQHYDKHGKGMGFASAVEYEKAAAAVVSNSKALHKKEAEDGDDIYYIKDTNEFVVVSKDGYIRTYFKPDDGINYYNRQ